MSDEKNQPVAGEASEDGGGSEGAAGGRRRRMSLRVPSDVVQRPEAGVDGASPPDGEASGADGVATRGAARASSEPAPGVTPLDQAAGGAVAVATADAPSEPGVDEIELGVEEIETEDAPRAAAPGAVPPPPPALAPERPPLPVSVDRIAAALSQPRTTPVGASLEDAEMLTDEAVELVEVPPPPPDAATGVLPAAGGTAAGSPAAPADAHAEELAPRKRRRGKPWFEEIFDEDYLRTLPDLAASQTAREVDLLVKSLAPPPGGQLLDVGCGSGRHAIGLAARGYEVVGLDLSLPLLLHAAERAQEKGVQVSFVHGDMRELAFEDQFDGAYCVFTTFGYFDDESNRRVLQRVGHAVKPGGRLVLELVNRDYVVANLPNRVWWEGDGCVVLEEVDFNFYTSRLVSHRSVVYEDGRQVEQIISIRAYSLHEIGKVLHSAGFHALDVSGSLSTPGRFFGTESRQLIIVAERKKAD